MHNKEEDGIVDDYWDHVLKSMNRKIDNVFDIL